MDKIKPCPKCGEADDLTCDYEDTMKCTYTYVQCNACLHIVKTLGNEEETIAKWNRQRRKR